MAADIHITELKESDVEMPCGLQSHVFYVGSSCDSVGNAVRGK